MDIEVLIADNGMVYTDGEFYGKRIYLGEDRSPSEFWQITQAEYDAIMEAVEDEEPATEEDYHAALAEFGVDV